MHETPSDANQSTQAEGMQLTTGIPSTPVAPETRSIWSIPISRRRAMQIGGAVVAAPVVAEVARVVSNPEIQNTILFDTKRTFPDASRTYTPFYPERILPQEVSDSVYDSLGLAERYPNTLSKDSFHIVSQCIGRLATYYYRKQKTENEEAVEKGFYEFNANFFQKILEQSDALGVDFVGTLLMWQTSGYNKSSPDAKRSDIGNEMVRMGVRAVDAVFEESPNPIIFKGAELFGNVVGIAGGARPFYYFAAARLEGPVTIGIHDIETVMIGRGLKDLEKSLPEQWPEIASYLKEKSPSFFHQYSQYVNMYDQYDQALQAITSEVHESRDIQQYLQQFYNPESLRNFLLDGDTVDGYQYLRTTAFWALLTDISSRIAISGYEESPTQEAMIALDATVGYYMAQHDPSGFFLDQMANPKMVVQLERDAANGNRTARKLLERYNMLHSMSDAVMTADTAINAGIAEDGSELNMDFQILTGVAYTRWLLREAYKHTYGKESATIHFTNPNELAYHAFLATANRESAPTYQLATSRPLDRATLTFLPPEQMFATMDAYIKQVYSKIAFSEPQENFRTFSWYFFKLIEERLSPFLAGGIHEYELSGDERMERFIDLSEQFGAYQNILTLPFSSWLRSFTAASGYIAKINKKPR